MLASQFSPTTLSVSKGAVVGFNNTSGVDHNVVFDTPAPAGTPVDVGLISSGTVNRTFDASGEFPFHCTIHNGMTGKITVP
jgi:plastocyanin